MSKIQDQARNLRYLASKNTDNKELSETLTEAAATIDTLLDVMSCRPYAKPPKREFDCMTETIDGLRESCGKEIGYFHYGSEISDSFRMLKIAHNEIRRLNNEIKELKKEQ